MYLVADLHCDLLEYLEKNSGARPFDEAVRCSIPQLRKGNVAFQVLAIYCSTDDQSVKSGMGQVAIFEELGSKYPKDFLRVRTFSDIAGAQSQGKIAILPAIENASGFSSETEPLKSCLSRFDQLIDKIGPILYLSLTHFGENRFSGGNATQGVGLESDGKELLHHLSGKKIAIDLSHTSDAAADDILNTIEKRGLDIPVIASHSNFRTVASHERNLPDDIAKEIIRRKGLIGLNFICDFIGTRGKRCFLEQIEYALKMGAEKVLCLGADFFHTPSAIRQFKMPADYQFFYEGFDSSACYPEWIDFVQTNLRLDSNLVRNIAGENMFRFLQNII